MASRDKKDLRPELVQAYEKAKEKYYSLYPNDPQPFITCTYRSGEEQNKLYNSKPKVTNAKAGQSPHNYNPSFMDVLQAGAWATTILVGVLTAIGWIKKMFFDKHKTK